MSCYMLSDYLKNTFGKKIHKLVLSTGMTCPNRDGTCGDKGCIFCSDSGSGEFAQDSRLPIIEQIENAKKNVPVSDKYIAYFQNFSNTYSSAEKIEELYSPIVKRDDIAVLSIATRPDCLPDDTIEVLSRLNKIKPVWIELGLQTIHEKTAAFIRRGYPLQTYTDVVKKLKNENITIITHLILGLPDETKSDMVESARFVGKITDGIKFHSLYITEGTDLANLYKSGSIKLLTKEEYIDTLCECIRGLHKNVVIHRLTGDPDKKCLVAPMWTKDKVKLLKKISDAFYDRNIVQGESLTESSYN